MSTAKTERYVPSPQPSTAGMQPNHNVHFQPINPAPKSPVQPQIKEFSTRC